MAAVSINHIRCRASFGAAGLRGRRSAARLHVVCDASINAAAAGERKTVLVLGGTGRVGSSAASAMKKLEVGQKASFEPPPPPPLPMA